ncbi:hypothetical protein LJC14_04090 [Treponema sp. OttesenSCG-928-L16]|nr:hypothetical protein [Treponema sp. OttesenSCG-928-L16]
MEDRIIHFEIEGKKVLGFDTGLSSQAFAQAKLAQFITDTGYIVGPGGGIDVWKPSGVTERNGSMVIWGPAFDGERLDKVICNQENKDRALDALRYWIRARQLLPQEEQLPYPWPAGAIISESNAILFPPDRLVKRSLDAEGAEAWLESAGRWVHPDLSGEEAAAFAAGAMVYFIFCGIPPFQDGDINRVRADIREGVFFPPPAHGSGAGRHPIRPYRGNHCSRRLLRKEEYKKGRQRG